MSEVLPEMPTVDGNRSKVLRALWVGEPGDDRQREADAAGRVRTDGGFGWVSMTENEFKSCLKCDSQLEMRTTCCPVFVGRRVASVSVSRRSVSPVAWPEMNLATNPRRSRFILAST